jgi:hypothetical protein
VAEGYPAAGGRAGPVPQRSQGATQAPERRMGPAAGSGTILLVEPRLESGA